MGALAANRSIIPVFRDSSCQSLLASASTDKVMADGDCLALPNGANSVETKQVAPGCQGIQHSIRSYRPRALTAATLVTVYSNPNCLGNETIAEVGDCMDMGITSYSVDCPYLNSSSSVNIDSKADSRTTSDLFPGFYFFILGYLAFTVLLPLFKFCTLHYKIHLFGFDSTHSSVYL